MKYNNLLKFCYFIGALIILQSCNHNKELIYTISIQNLTEISRIKEPIEINLSKLHLGKDTKGYFCLTFRDEVIPFQLVDLDADGYQDEITFLVDVKANSTKSLTLVYSESFKREQISFEEKTWAQLVLKKDMKQYENLSAIGGNLFNECLHYGPAFENEKIAYCVYFDQSMSVDVYGKRENQLELKQTNWFSDSIQQKNGFGKDILAIGNTVSIGAIRSWNGKSASLIDNIHSRNAKIISHGPIKTVVEMKTNGWKIEKEWVDVTSRFTLYSGHHEFKHEMTISSNNPQICTGLIKKNNGISYSSSGIQGVWAANYSNQDTHLADTIGLGLIVPEKYISHTTEDSMNFIQVLKTQKNQTINWYGIAAWEQEKGGFKNKEDFFNYLEKIKHNIENPVSISIKKKRK